MLQPAGAASAGPARPSTAASTRTQRALAPLGGADALRRPMARDGPALGDHAEALHLRSPPGPWWPRRRPASPRRIGGQRNWDYRYAWLRDSAFTAFACRRLGFYDEAMAFNDWIEERCRETDPTDPQLQIVYGIDGSSDLTELELPHLEGYRGSGPVRIGNGAARPAPARRLRRADGRGLPVQQAGADQLGAVDATCAGCSTGWPTTGSSPTRASGRCAAGGATSSTRGSCAGWPSSARCGCSPSAACPATRSSGAPSATRSTRRSWPAAGAASRRRSCSTTAATSWTPATC